MAQKALVTRIYNCSRDDEGSGDYTLNFEAAVCDGAGGSVQFVAEVTASSWNPTLPNWRSRIRTKIIEVADSSYGLTVDDVLYPDLTIL